jgi:hypothetical protein
MHDDAVAQHDGAVGHAVLSVTITGIPAGATLSGLAPDAAGSLTLTPGQLTGLTVKPPSNSDADFTLRVTVTSTDAGGLTASTSANLAVNVTAVADTPTVSAANATGTAATPIALTLSGALTDRDGSEAITYVIHGVPHGFALDRGSNNGDNTWTLTATEAAGAKLISPETFNGQLKLYATSVSHDHDGSSQASAAAAFTVGVGNVSGGYLIDLGLDANVGAVGVGARVAAGPNIDLFPATGGLLTTGGAYVKEDTPFTFNDAPNLLSLPALNTVTSLISRIVFSGLPTGASLSAGVNKDGGVWEVTPAQLSGLKLIPVPNSDVDFTIVTSARLTTLATIALTSTPIHMQGIADASTLTATSSSAVTPVNEGQPIPLAITATLADTDGSETLSYSVSHLPVGAILSAGTDNGNGTWTLRAADLPGLTVIPGAGFSGTTTTTSRRRPPSARATRPSRSPP